MKYILVIDRIATGGAERCLIDFYRHLEKEGHKPYIFALTGNLSQSKWTEGLRVTYGASDDENNLIKKAVQQMFLLFRLRRLVKKLRPAGIFSYLEKSNLITIFTPAGNVKKVVSVHNVLSIQYKKIHSDIVRKIVAKMIQFAYNHCANVVAVSKQVKDDLIDNFGVNPGNISIINNYVDRLAIKTKSVEQIDNFIFNQETKYILNVGRFSDQKAQWKLVKAFAIYAEDVNSNVELLLMGAGEYAENLKKLISDLRVSDRVHVLPFNVNPYKYMAKAYLFVLSSSFEGFPIVLAEISSLRIPFVGSRKSIPEEMFDDKSVWEQCIFDCQDMECDFSTKLHEDEYKLAGLIKKGVEEDSFRNMVLFHTMGWEQNNDKEIQFLNYDTMLSSRK